MKRNCLLLTILITSITFLTGCWDKSELTDLAIVNAVGVDKTDNGEYLLTFQIINPGNVASEQEGGSSGIPVTVYSTTGNNLEEAARIASKEISRKVYYAHANLVIIGEELARGDITKIFDIVERNPQFRTTASIVVAENSRAIDMLKILTPIDKLPANKITKALKFTEKALGESIDVSVGDVIKRLTNPGKEPIMSTFIIKGDLEQGQGQSNTETTEAAARLSAGGLAIFKEGKLEKVIYGQTARSIVWILNKLDQTVIGINWDEQKLPISFAVNSRKSKIHLKIKNNKPIYTIHIKAEGDIREATVPIDLTDPKILQQLEKNIAKKIKKEMLHAVKIIQKEKTDIFGFGEIFYRKSPDLWKKVDQDWNEIVFPELTVNVKVDVFIRRTGLRNNPYFSDLK
ncbi:Ger(x)C family spore germination protein [Heyndrickxia sporothermodurans]|uniref:Ger(x)C family spore germination protein n=1 Tax=Heyndrickxia sporothermodurans TaxID=46224 RepID=UPI002E24AC9A|nr:Ger(x)C family spore germination protein [Heyndrickxia sporothermodurans]MED3698460.1 Ger(x)C family spore germination protein [Heyndrickxia sporothermodurans]